MRNEECRPSTLKPSSPQDLKPSSPQVLKPSGPQALKTSGPQDPTTSSPTTGLAGVEGDADVFIMEAELDDVRLSLDFIVFRSEDPYAEINGTEVHLGSTIEGWRVKAIETDRVRLSDGRRNIVLRAP